MLEARIAPGLATPSSCSNTLFLMSMRLEHRLDHEVGFGERVEVERGREPAHALLDLGHRDAALPGGVLVVAAHDRDAAVERLLRRLDDASPECRR